VKAYSSPFRIRVVERSDGGIANSRRGNHPEKMLGGRFPTEPVNSRVRGESQKHRMECRGCADPGERGMNG